MTELLSLLGVGSLFSILYSIIIGVILYIITDKYGYIINVIIYGAIRIISTFFALSEITIGVFIMFVIVQLLISIVVVYIAQALRGNFEYDTIIWYIAIVRVAQIIASKLISAIVLKVIPSLFLFFII